jgi:hypothetical protein
VQNFYFPKIKCSNEPNPLDEVFEELTDLIHVIGDMHACKCAKKKNPPGSTPPEPTPPVTTPPVTTPPVITPPEPTLSVCFRVAEAIMVNDIRPGS